MDVQWKLARQRNWIELAAQEGMTNRALGRLAGVSERTVRRWCAKFRAENLDRYVSIASVPCVDEYVLTTDFRAFEPPTPAVTVTPPVGQAGDGAGVEASHAMAQQAPDEPEPPVGFAEVVPANPPEGPQIQIEVRGGGRVTLAGPLDPALLSRLIAVLNIPC